MTMQDVTPDLRALLDEVQLPGLSQSAVRVVQLDRDPANGPAEFAVPIEADPGLTAQVLRFVNSSYFGFRHEISNVQAAITLVGIRSIKSFVLWNAVFDILPNPRCGDFSVKALWQDSLRRALFARTVARQLLGAVPVAGWAVKGAVAYGGTRGVGEAAQRYFAALAERGDQRDAAV